MNKVKLSEVANVELSSIDKKIVQGEKSVKLCNFTDVYYNWAITKSIVDKCMEGSVNESEFSKFALRKGQVAITKDSETRSDIGMSTYISEDFDDVVLAYHCALITPKEGKVNGKYLNALLNDSYGRKYFANQASGSGQRYTLSKEAIESIKLPLPSMEKQNAIGSFFSNIDRKIELNNRINDNLLHQLKLLYDYWFTQFDFPDKNGKPYKSSGGSLQWDSKVKKNIPIGWSVEKASCCIERIGTGLNPRDNFVLGNGTIRYVTVKNLTTLGTIDFSGCDTIDDSARDLVHKRSDIKIGDILFASIAPLGRCYLIQEPPKTWDINESVFAIRPNYQIITSEYLYAFFTSESFVKGATSSSTGSIFKGIRINTLLDSLLIVPPKYILQLYSSMASPLMKKIASNCNEISELTKLRDWLLPMLMNGQASITN